MKGSNVMEVHRTTVVWPQPKQRLGVMVTIPLPCQAVNCGGTETRPQSRCNSSTSSILGMLLFEELPRARNISGFPKDDGHFNFFEIRSGEVHRLMCPNLRFFACWFFNLFSRFRQGPQWFKLAASDQKKPSLGWAAVLTACTCSAQKPAETETPGGLEQVRILRASA